MTRLGIPPLGFPNEEHYGNGLAEVWSPGMSCFIEGTLSHHMRYAEGKPICLTFYARKGFVRHNVYVNDFFEAKMVIQATFDEFTYGGNDGALSSTGS